jgi:hypothetical protein
MIVWIGVHPRTFTAKTEATVQALIAQVESKASVARLGAPPRLVNAGSPR